MSGINFQHYFKDINTNSKPKKRTPLQMLVVVNYSEADDIALTNTFKMLIEQNANYNAKDQSGLTVLHRAILKVNLRLIWLLLDLENIDLNVIFVNIFKSRVH